MYSARSLRVNRGLGSQFSVAPLAGANSQKLNAGLPPLLRLFRLNPVNWWAMVDVRSDICAVEAAQRVGQVIRDVVAVQVAISRQESESFAARVI